MDLDRIPVVVGLLLWIPTAFITRWLSYRIWRIVAFVVGFAIGISLLLAVGLGVPWLFEEVHAGHWIVGMMQTGIAASVLGALHGVWRRAGKSDEPA